MPSGRKSKIMKYNLGSEIERLRSQGYSYRRTAEIINEEHPDIEDISDDIVWRWENHRHNRTTDTTEIVTRYNKYINDVIFKINTIDIDNTIKSALKTYIRGLSRGFERHLKELARQSPDSIEKVYCDRMNTVLRGLSNLLCRDCKRKVTRLADEELKRRDI